MLFGQILNAPVVGGQWHQQSSNQRGSPYSVSLTSRSSAEATDQSIYSIPDLFATHIYPGVPHNVPTPPVAFFSSTAPTASVGSTTEAHLQSVQDIPGPSNSRPTESDQRMPSPAKRSSSNRRTPAVGISRANWDEHHNELKRLWIDQDMSLPETMKIMAEKFQFKPSVKQYKTQFEKWGWSKNLRTSDAAWMRKKSEQRKLEEEKDTVFQYRGVVYTESSLQQRLQRKKDQLEETIVATNAPTPTGMRYFTPRNDISSPLHIVSPTTSGQQNKWTPVKTPHPQRPHGLELRWNGRTKAEFKALYQEAQVQERLGSLDDAENMLREALAGFENLLSTTHEDTNTAAYRLASFYARNNRMKDADTVLDWVTSNHIESFGMEHPKTVDHLLHILDIFHSWSRTEDAIAFISQIIDAFKIAAEGTPADAPRLNTDPPDTSNRSGMRHTRSRPNRPHPLNHSIPITEASEPSVIDYQLGIATAYMKADDEMAEPLLVRLVEQCEKYPKRLAVQILRCRSALLELYFVQGGDKMGEALDKAQETFQKILGSEQKKTESLFRAAGELAKWHARAGRYETADDMFIQVQSDAAESLGVDSSKTIAILEHIGLFYQEEGRWDDAQPRFEQALAACYTAFRENSEHTKCLEAALDNQYYRVYCPSLEKIESALYEENLR